MTKFTKAMIPVMLAAASIGSVYAQDGSASNGGGAAGGGNTASNTTFQEWLNMQSGKNNGRISRKMYMDEAGRRWDMMDKSKKGLTMAEIHGMYSPPAVMGGPTTTNKQDMKGIKQ